MLSKISKFNMIYTQYTQNLNTVQNNYSSVNVIKNQHKICLSIYVYQRSICNNVRESGLRLKQSNANNIYDFINNILKSQSDK